MAAAASEMIRKRQWLALVFAGYFVILGGIYADIYSRRITVGDDYKYGASGFVLRLVNPCDYVVNGYRIGYNLFNKDIDFIWNLKGQIDVIAATIGHPPDGGFGKPYPQIPPENYLRQKLL